MFLMKEHVVFSVASFKPLTRCSIFIYYSM